MDMFQAVQSDIVSDDLYTVQDFFERYGYDTDVLDEDSLYELLEEMGEDYSEDNFYFNPHGLFNRIIFINDYFQYSIPAITQEFIDAGILKHFLHVVKTAKVLKEDGEYSKLLWLLDKPQRLKFLAVYKEFIDEKEFTDLVFEVYQSSEYGFNVLSQDILDNVVFTSKLSEQDITDIDHDYDVDNGFVTVYRGMQSKSTPLTQALSWSLKVETAKFFATRFKGDGTMYSAKVALKDIHKFMPSRGEAEVIIQPQNLVDVKMFKD